MNKTFYSNIGWLTVAFVVGRGASLVWNLALVRYFTATPDIYGQYAVLLSQYYIWSIVAEGNIEYAIMQRLSTGQISAEKAWTAGFHLRVCSGLFSAIVYYITIAIFYSQPIVREAALWFSLALFFQAVGSLPNAVWSGLNNMRPQAISGILSTFALVISGFFVITMKGSLTGFAFCNFLANIILLIFLWPSAVKQWGSPNLILKRNELGDYKSIISLAVPLLASSFIFVVFYRIDVLLVSKVHSDVSAGILNAALILFFGFCDLTWSQLSKAIVPVMGSLWERDRKRLYERLRLGLYIFAIFSVIALNGLLMIGDSVFGLLFGKQSIWKNSLPVLVILLTTYWFVILYAIIYRIMLLEEKAREYAKISAYSLIFKVLIGIPLIYFFSYIGAAISISITQIVMTGFLWMALSAASKSEVPSQALLLKFLCVISVTSLFCYLSLESKTVILWMIYSGVMVCSLLYLIQSLDRSKKVFYIA